LNIIEKSEDKTKKKYYNNSVYLVIGIPNIKGRQPLLPKPVLYNLFISGCPTWCAPYQVHESSGRTAPVFLYTLEGAHVYNCAFVSHHLNLKNMTFKSSIVNGWTGAFWNPSFWLTKNMTWEDFNDTSDVTYPKYYEVCYPIVFSVFILFLRYLTGRFEL